MRLWTILLAVALSAQPLTEVAQSPTYTEGPVFDAQGYLFYSHNHGIYRLAPDGRREEWINDSNAGFNGHKILPDGTHLVCAAKQGEIWLMSSDAKLLRKAVSGQRAPNDLTLDRNGGYYFSDPGGSREAPIGTVHYVNREGRVSESAGGLSVPNGLVLSPDARWLYVAETVPNRILRYAVQAPGVLGKQELFARLPAREGHAAEPDGLAVDRSGNLYVAHLGTGFVRVLDAQGKALRDLPGGNYDVSNLVFGGRRKDELYITGSIAHRSRSEGRVYRLKLPGVRGL
jgi:gluconolactonase